MREVNDEQDRDIYMAEYRTLLKAVLVETLSENNSQVRVIFKEAIKEWLSAQMQDGGAWAVRMIAACFLVGVVWLILHPSR